MDTDLNKIDHLNNALNFIEGLCKASYVLSAEQRQELYEKGLLDSPGVRSSITSPNQPFRTEKALPEFKAKGYKAVEFNRYLQPELLNALKHYGVHYAILKDSKTNNLIVCYDERQSAKMREVEKSVYETCKNFQSSMATLKKINETVKGATIRSTKGLTDFQYHILCEKLPEYGVSFAGGIAKDSSHKINFSSVDDAKVLQCIKDCADYACKPEGIEMMKKIHVENNLFKQLESRLKNAETSYIVSSQTGTVLKIEPNKYTILRETTNGKLGIAPFKDNPIEGNVFKTGTWQNLSQQVLEMKTPVLLTEAEAKDYFFKSRDEQESIIEQKTAEAESTFTQYPGKTPDDFIKEVAPDADIGQSRNAPALEDLE